MAQESKPKRQPVSTKDSDPNTLGLWLFDDPQYSASTLTDSGPYRADMFLDAGRDRPPSSIVNNTRGLVPGKFGNALRLPIGNGAGVSWTWPAYSRYNSTNQDMQQVDNEVPEPLNLGYLDFTFEFWFKADGEQKERGTVWSLMRDAGALGNTLLLEPGRSAFTFRTFGGTYGGVNLDEQIHVKTDATRLNDGKWHHLAFTYVAKENQMRHYVDGKLQPLPRPGTWQPVIVQLRDLRLGRDYFGKQELYGWLDELRVSKIVRYKNEFTPPGSFSKNHGQRKPKQFAPTGPPLLFPPKSVTASSAALEISKEDFSSDPQWDGLFNRSNRSDFGFDDSLGALAGAMSCSQRAYYAQPIGALNPLIDRMVASGDAAYLAVIDTKNSVQIIDRGDIKREVKVMNENKETDILVGWFNSKSYERNGQLPKGIYLWMGDNNRIFASITTRGVAAHHTKYLGYVPDKFSWKLEYDPAGNGRVILRVTNHDHAEKLANKSSIKQKPSSIRKQDFATDPSWVGLNHRKAQGGYGWNKSKTAVGGNFARSNEAQYYADTDLRLTLDDRLTAKGSFTVENAQQEGSPRFGWFDSHSGQGLTFMVADGWRLMAFTDLPEEGSQYGLVGRIAGSQVYHWEMNYDPDAGNHGVFTVKFTNSFGHVVGTRSLALQKATREYGLHLDAFGWCGFSEGGNPSTSVQGAFVDNLEYTVREGGPSVRQAILALNPGEKKQIGLLDRFGVVTRHQARYVGGTRSMAIDNLEYTARPILKDAAKPIPFGARKHLFLDDQLLDHTNGLKLVGNPPIGFDVTDFRNSEIWEPTPRFGPAIPDPCTVFEDENGKLKFLYTNGGMWGGKKHAVCLAETDDGIHFTKPTVGKFPWLGSLENNIVSLDGSQGCVIYDKNPAEPAARRYKYFAMTMNRGFYVYTSPDCRTWTRNECAMLPFDPDGSISAFWDDQIGQYRAYVRVWAPGLARQIGYASADDAMQPWPFFRAKNPQFNPYMLPRPSAGEVDLLDTYGQAYRFKAFKYPGAPDAYFAFPWRMIQEGNIRPGSLLMVSRNGEEWQRFEKDYYLSSDMKVEGRKIHEALMEHGMVIRGDEIWQYATTRVTEHGGLMIGGVDHEGGQFDRFLRVRQRLDGFVSLETQDSGEAITKPLKIDGSSMEINVKAEGMIRVAVLDETGDEIRGFGLTDCIPVTGDHIRKQVKWKKEISELAGRTVRLKFELEDAKLFAFEIKQ